MSQPTSVAVSVDSTEYCRYEHSFDTITATVTISGGATYVGEDITVSLIKARRSRDAVVATSTLTFNGSGDPQEGVVTFSLPDTVDQDLISLVRFGKYFVKAYSDAASATATIGAGVNGTVTLTVTAAGTAGNLNTVQVTTPAGTAPLTVTKVGTAIIVALSVNGGVPVAADNMALLVALKINAALLAEGITSVYSGTGVTALAAPEGPTAFAGGRDEVAGITDDFDLRVITVTRLKQDFLFGIDLKATDIKFPKFQPTAITDVSIIEVSKMHPDGSGVLSYNYHTNDSVNATADIGSGANGTVTITADGANAGSAGNSFSVQVTSPPGTSPLTVSVAGSVLTVALAVTVGVPDAAANTAALVAAAVTAVAGFTGVASGTGSAALPGVEGPTAFAGGITDIIRTLTWRGGETVSITAAGTYLLQTANIGPAAKLLPNKNHESKEYICVRVKSVALLPTSNVSESVFIERKKIDDETLGNFIDEAVAWTENDALTIYLEPTNVVTDRDPSTVQFADGVNAPVPIFTDTDYDFLVNPLTYFIRPSDPSWITIQTQFPRILRVDTLFGAIANTRVIDIDLEWIELSTRGGIIQLVPFNQEIAFDYIGLLWVNAIRGAVELPNFWHFNMIAGIRDTPAELRELVAKKAALNVLDIAGLGIHPGVGSLALSRDGVSEAVTYNSQAQFGLFTGTINSYKEWVETNMPLFRAKYRGSIMVVV
jgi:hypothetical protein